MMTGSGDVRGSDFFVLAPADAGDLSIGVLLARFRCSSLAALLIPSCQTFDHFACTPGTLYNL